MILPYDGTLSVPVPALLRQAAYVGSVGRGGQRGLIVCNCQREREAARSSCQKEFHNAASGAADWSTNVTMKNGDERSEVAPTLGGILHVLDTVTGMRVDDFLSERFKGIPRGDDLIENVSAVRVFRNQSLKSLNLAADFPQPEDERILFSLRVDVFHGYGLG